MARTGRMLALAPLVCVLTIGQGEAPETGELRDFRADGRPHVLATPFGGPFTTAAAEPDGPATPTDYGDCGPDALRETGLQGQVPLADQQSGRSAKGYRCNVRRVGRSDIGLRGQNFQVAWYRDCAYVSTIGIQAISGALGEPDPSLDGIAALDVTDPAQPRLTDIVKSPVGKSSHEAIEVAEARGLLVTTIGGLVAQYIEVYDVKGDCRHPRFLGRYDAGIPIFHGMRISDDGNTVYATDTFRATGAGQEMHVVDISNPRDPRRIITWDSGNEDPSDLFGIHDLEVSQDGNRAYLGTAPYSALIGVIGAGPPSVGDDTSLAILDTSEIQERKRDPDPRYVSRLNLPNIGHTVQRMRVGGKPYLLVSGEAPIGGPQQCPWAWGHIIDISDERNPRRVSDLRLEVNRQANCGTIAQDPAALYSIHYAGVDSERETRYAFYTYYQGGLRVFDVSDPLHPTEVGYYQPPPTPGTKFPPLAPTTPDSPHDTFDYTTSVVRYRPETGEIWVVSVNSGFQVLQLTGSLAHQRGRVTVRRPRVATALRRRWLRARVSCAQPCRARIRLRVGGRRSGRRTVELPREGAKTVRLRLGSAARRRLRRSPRARVGAAAVIHDRLTGERQQRVRSRVRWLRA